MKGGKSKANTSMQEDTKLAVKRGDEKKIQGAGPKRKAGKDPNRLKRPLSPFFIFMEQFRMDFKEKYPLINLVSVISKAGGDRWKSLSESEKAPYVAKAEKLKAEYEEKLKAYDANEETRKQSADEEETATIMPLSLLEGSWLRQSFQMLLACIKRPWRRLRGL